MYIIIQWPKLKSLRAKIDIWNLEYVTWRIRGSAAIL
jgi:hypothetical protein